MKITNLLDQYWLFPPLNNSGSHNRVFTKHFTNLVLVLPSNEIALLSWLIYQSGEDNTITYSSAGLRQYQKSVKLLIRLYKSDIGLNHSLPNTRIIFKKLVSKGLILRTKQDKVYLINPNLTYHKKTVGIKFYNSWCMLYRSGEVNPELYINHVNI